MWNMGRPRKRRQGEGLRQSNWADLHNEEQGYREKARESEISSLGWDQEFRGPPCEGSGNSCGMRDLECTVEAMRNKIWRGTPS